MIDEQFLANFKSWLVDNKGFKQKSAGDVVCRVRRLEKIEEFPPKGITSSYYIHDLNQNANFVHLSLYVKSQLRRSKRLLDEFTSASSM